MNRNVFLLVLVAFLFSTAESYTQENTAPVKQLLIQGGQLFDGLSDTLRKNTGIVVKNGKITAVDIDAKQTNLTC